jgi:bacterioferritin-associated ferredoxin
MYACICRGVTEADVRQAGRAGIIAPEELLTVLGLDDPRCCGRCAARIEDFVALARQGAAEAGTGRDRARWDDEVARHPAPVVAGTPRPSGGSAARSLLRSLIETTESREEGPGGA